MLKTLRMILSIFWLSIFFSSTAQEQKAWIFQPGGWWDTEVWQFAEVSPTGEDIFSIERYEIPGDTVINNEKCLRMTLKKEGGEPKLFAVLKVEGEKVFFKENSSSANWKLLYDFGIAENEVVQVFSMHPYYYDFAQDRTAYPIEKRLISYGYDENLGNHFIMSFEDRRIYIEPEIDSDWVRGYSWIYGIGGTAGVIYNGNYGILGGATSRVLIKSGLEDTVLYEYPSQSSVKLPTELSPTAPADRIFDLQGRELREPIPGQPYIKGGHIFLEK